MRYRPITLVAYLLAGSLAVVFFQIYGFVTKPAVPRSIQQVVEQIGYGVPVGDRVNAIGEKYDVEPRFVPHLGYTFNLGLAKSGWPKSAQVWLLLDKKDREKKDPRRARVPAIEVLSREPQAPYVFAGNIISALGTPTLGCVAMSEGRYRDVRYWMSKDSSAGIAVLSDFNPQALDGSRSPGGATAMLVFAGAFDSSRTLRGDYIPWPCKTASKIDHVDHAANAAEIALLTFAEGAGAEQPVRLAGQVDAVKDACANPAPEGDGWHDARAADLHISLPGEFPDTVMVGPYIKLGQGRSSTIDIYPVRSELDVGNHGDVVSSCSWEDARGQVTMRVGERSDGLKFVTAYFVIGGKPSFAIVATTSDARMYSNLLHSVRSAVDFPIWNINSEPAPKRWKEEPRY